MTTTTSYSTSVIDVCPGCGEHLYASSSFCTACGAVLSQPNSQPFAENSQHHPASQGFGQMFGLQPSIALLTLIVDTMLFGAEAGTLGTSLPFSVAAGVILGIITYKAQKRYYGDDHEAALIKALMLGFLTAIPTPLPALVYVPSGLVGLAHNLRRK